MPRHLTNKHRVFKISTSSFLAFVTRMVLRSNPRIRPEDEIQPAPEPSPGSVVARIGGRSVGSR